MNVKYNPVDKALASGGNDRTVKYWDLDSYSLVNTKTINNIIRLQVHVQMLLLYRVFYLSPRVSTYSQLPMNPLRYGT